MQPTEPTRQTINRIKQALLSEPIKELAKFFHKDKMTEEELQEVLASPQLNKIDTVLKLKLQNYFRDAQKGLL